MNCVRMLICCGDSAVVVHSMITIAPRLPSGIFLESTRDEAYGVLQGEDRHVKEIMTREVVTSDASIYLKEAIRMVQDQSSILIICLDHQPALAVTEVDMALMMRSDDYSALATFHEIINKREAVRCHEDAILADVVSAMLDHRTQHIPVVDAQGNAVGVLSLMDAMGAMTPAAAAKWLTKMRRMSSHRGGLGNSDSVVGGSLASRKPLAGGEPKERGDEENET